MIFATKPISWCEAPVRRVDSYAAPKGCLIAPGTPGQPGLNAQHYPGFPGLQGRAMQTTLAALPVAPSPRPQPVVTTASAIAMPPAPADHTIRATPTSPCPANSTQERPPIASGKVHYRAVHTKTKWRKATNHSSLESAIRGANGAAALFRRKVRIDYAKHGEPLFALVWEEGAQTGSLIRAEAGQADGIRVVSVPVSKLQAFEALGGMSEQELSSYFSRS